MKFIQSCNIKKKLNKKLIFNLKIKTFKSIKIFIPQNPNKSISFKIQMKFIQSCNMKKKL